MNIGSKSHNMDIMLYIQIIQEIQLKRTTF